MKYLFILMFIVLNLNLYGQKHTLKVEGTIIDDNKQPIAEATVVLYSSKDSSALKFVHSDLKGQYLIELKDVKDELILLAKHLNYQEKLIPISRIRTDTTIRKDIQMPVKTFDLEDVIVTKFKSPYQVVGDTIEFNVDAFNMDSTTVVEDLLKKLPGIIIWADKKITLNGKEIKKVYVDGKPFFFDDKQFAIKNLPNYVVDKVKVYNSSNNRTSTDEVLIMDIILKANKKRGLFGKLGLGLGFEEKQNIDATLARYTPDYRIAIVNNYNTINRINENLKDQMINSSFGQKMSLSSSSNDNYQGVFTSKYHASEFAITKNVDYKLNYRFIENKNNIIRESILEGIYSRSFNVNNIDRKSKIHSVDQKFSKSLGKNTQISADLTYEKDKNISAIKTNSDDRFNDNQYKQISNSIIDKKEDNLYGGINLNTPIKGYYNRKSIIRVSYNYNYASSHSVSEINGLSSIVSNDRDSINFRRNENLDKNAFKQVFNFGMENLGAFLNRTNIFRIDLLNELAINKNAQANVVNSFNDNSSSYTIYDKALSYATDFREIKYTPSLLLEKTFRKHRTNRYDKYISFKGKLQSVILHSKSNSNQVTHNYQLEYQKLTPSFTFKIGKEIVKNYSHSITTNFSKTIIDPQFDQIAVIIDTTNLFYRQVPNLTLKPSDVYSGSINYAYESLRSIGNSINMTAGFNVINNSIVDSLFLQNAITQFKFVNVDQTNQLFFKLNTSKTFNLYNFPVKYTLDGNYQNTNSHRFVNDKKEVIKNILYQLSGSTLFPVHQKHDLQLDINYLNYQLFTSGENYNSKNLNYSLGWDMTLTDRLSTLFRLTKKDLNIDANNDILICNVDFLYKAFKNKQSEFKLSVYDLFDKNINIVNYQSIAGLSTVSTNNLKRYFLFTYSYYLRKF